MYADLEENYGFKSHSIEILERCLKVAPEAEKSEVINIILAKVTKLCGIIKAREVYKVRLEGLRLESILSTESVGHSGAWNSIRQSGEKTG